MISRCSQLHPSCTNGENINMMLLRADGPVQGHSQGKCIKHQHSKNRFSLPLLVLVTLQMLFTKFSLTVYSSWSLPLRGGAGAEMTRVTNDSQSNREHPAGLRLGTEETLQENRARFASHGSSAVKKQTLSSGERQC